MRMRGSFCFYRPASPKTLALKLSVAIRSREVVHNRSTAHAAFPNCAEEQHTTVPVACLAARAVVLLGNDHLNLERNQFKFAIAPTRATIPSGGGGGGVTVTTDAGCAWTAVSNAAWIRITTAQPVTAAVQSCIQLHRTPVERKTATDR